jgi:hypothetical protein
MGAGMPDEVTWRVSPQVFSDLHTIIDKHGMGFPWTDDDAGWALYPPSGPDAAALEIIEKYGLRKGIPLKVVVDYKMDGYEKPEYEGEGV